ncbi:hypothetical protein EJ03DRAFT_95332 [Teratosphaeria nubilosa]|uniref:DUF4045 domain-containing protein n=1 Tax=Teratosphaeria nubilosa TaxID=161662 RepID=A0A6G1L942_9PEZI|nr:hypothetical protein EJ03DRAFT_95332 [Teratosphaeria nubilosa]
MEFVDQQAASPSPAAADEDPAAFLQSIRELTAKREREDAERFRKLEEEVKRTREERANRRAERARSISPEKADSTDSLPAFWQSPTNVSRFEHRPPVTPPSRTTATPMTMDHEKAPTGPPSPTKDIPEFKGFGSARNSAASMSSMAQSPDRISQTPQSASSLARSGTLSWQQRPSSRAGSRPNFVAQPETSNAEKSMATPQATEPSRDQIAASLGARDPSWFRQTADRGIGSAAYRKSKDEPAATEMSRSGSGRKGLPGLSRDTTEPERQSSPAPSESIRSDPVTRPSSTTRNSVTSSRFSVASSSTSTPSKPDLKSLIAQDAQQQEASPVSDTTSSNGGDRPGLNRKLTMSSSQARLADAADRPSSPTKGMGGFVSSAMMKRSESVSKRWSAQAPPSLSRHGSVASVRSGLSGLQGSHSMPKLEPAADSRIVNDEQLSRPAANSSNNLPGLAQVAQVAQDENEFVKPALPRHSRSKSVASNYTTNEHDNLTSPPGSPSKRFSPTKSSWIESALTQRPESPKPNTAKNSQPSWMANIAKAKAERGSVDLTSSASTPKPLGDGTPGAAKVGAPFGQGMLKRSDSRSLAPTPRSSTPPIARELHKLDDKPNTDATPSNISMPKAEDSEPAVPAKSPSKSSSFAAPSSPQAAAEKPKAETPKPLVTAPPAKEKSGVAASELAKSPSAALLEKAKPEAPAKPQTDFRATLRSRPRPEAKRYDTPEFLSKFGQLRKTQTEKYVAPDVLKDNITRGKNDLAKTGVPVKTARRDELRESLLAKKDDWKKAKDEGRELPGAVHERKISATTPLTPPKPEALARRELLGRQNSIKSSPEKPKQATSEALVRHKSLKEQPEVPALKREATFPVEFAKLETLSKQTSAPTVTPSKPQTETSKLASRFNPGLAGLLARGPPGTSSGSSSPARTATPSAVLSRTDIGTSEAAAEGPLQDMRKGRAKGPKKRKQGGAEGQSTVATAEQSDVMLPPRSTDFNKEAAVKDPVIAAASSPLQAPKPRAPPGSAASIMMASLRSPKAQESPAETEKPSTPTIPPKSPGLKSAKPDDTPKVDPMTGVPTFEGFSKMKKATPSLQTTIASKIDDDKENSTNGTASVKSAASMWAKQALPPKTGAPPQIQLPSKRDEEAAMRSAGLLASSTASRSPSRGLGIDVPKGPRDLATPPGSAGLPPKPAKSSRIVSGQLQEASPNKIT